jgi:hypothetical protein
MRKTQGKHTPQEQRKKEKLAAKRAEANARAQDVESDASDENPGMCCAGCVCAH